MEKIISVTNTAQGKKYTQCVKLQGAYLLNFGFVFGDKLSVTIEENQIVIKNLGKGYSCT
jgi:hypothetical protein